MSFSKETKMRAAAKLVSDILLELKELTKPGVSLDMLDEVAARRIKEAGAISANLGYKPEWAPTPYPATICCSVDYEICHAPPRGRTLQEGSVVTYDLGLRLNEAYGDAAITVAVGQVDNRKNRAMRYGLRALMEGIAVVKAGVPISAIGKAIEGFASLRGYTVIREFGGHHIGLEAMHESPLIPHVPYPEDDAVLLQEGAVICIEPMITPGKGVVKVAKEDGWTAFVQDGQPVVMFEAMLLVTKEGSENLTKDLFDISEEVERNY